MGQPEEQHQYADDASSSSPTSGSYTAFSVPDIYCGVRGHNHEISLTERPPDKVRCAHQSPSQGGPCFALLP